jgi:hypothetical protein
MLSGLNMSLGLLQGKPILCRKCGQGGGTLKRVDDGYIHDQKCPTQRVRPVPVSKEELERLKKK